MSPRARRVVFGVLVVLLGTLVLTPLLMVKDVPGNLLFLGFLVEIGVLIVGIGIAVTEPPTKESVFAQVAKSSPSSSEPKAEPLVLGPVTAYRGASPPPFVAPITRASARRITLGIIAALVFTAATVPLSMHLPRWIEAELVVGLWWALLSGVLAFVAYRGSKIEDDHRAGGPPIVDLGASKATPKLGWILEGVSDPEGCVVALALIAVVGIAMLGAWLVVELIAPAVFIVAYRAVVRALSKAHAANTRGDWLRSTVSGMGWAALGTAPLAAVVGLAHLVMTMRAS